MICLASSQAGWSELPRLGPRLSTCLTRYSARADAFTAGARHDGKSHAHATAQEEDWGVLGTGCSGSVCLSGGGSFQQDPCVIPPQLLSSLRGLQAGSVALMPCLVCSVATPAVKGSVAHW